MSQVTRGLHCYKKWQKSLPFGDWYLSANAVIVFGRAGVVAIFMGKFCLKVIYRGRILDKVVRHGRLQASNLFGPSVFQWVQHGTPGFAGSPGHLQVRPRKPREVPSEIPFA